MSIKHIAHPLAIETLADDGFFMGYASVFNEKDSQNEIVQAGAFKRSLALLQEKDHVPAMLWMHDPTIPIGVWLSLKEDKNGLVVQGRLALSTQKGREAYELLKMKALTGLSIGYRVVSSRIDQRRKARILTDVDLFEISLVTFPSNDSARIRRVKMPHRVSARSSLSRSEKVVSSSKRKRKKTAETKKKITTSEDMTRVVVGRLEKAAQTLKKNSTRRK